MSYDHDLAAYRRALADTERRLVDLGPAWTAPTPCAGWDLAALVTHLIGQHRGFARAVATGDADAAEYMVASPSAAEALATWRASATHLADVFAGADRDASVRLVEVDPQRLIPVGQVLRMQLLDTVVHCRDLAVTLGGDYRPDPDLVDRVHAIALRVPTGAARERPGAAFAAPR